MDHPAEATVSNETDQSTSYVIIPERKSSLRLYCGSGASRPNTKLGTVNPRDARTQGSVSRMVNYLGIFQLQLHGVRKVVKLLSCSPAHRCQRTPKQVPNRIVSYVVLSIVRVLING